MTQITQLRFLAASSCTTAHPDRCLTDAYRCCASVRESPYHRHRRSHRPDALLGSPGLNQRSIDSEVLVRTRTFFACLFTSAKNRTTSRSTTKSRFLENTASVPHRVVHAKAHWKPAEQQVVVDLQTSKRSGRALGKTPAIKAPAECTPVQSRTAESAYNIELWTQRPATHSIRQLANGPQWMILVRDAPTIYSLNIPS